MDWIYPILTTWAHIVLGVSVGIVILATLCCLSRFYYEIEDRKERIRKERLAGKQGVTLD